MQMDLSTAEAAFLAVLRAGIGNGPIPELSDLDTREWAALLKLADQQNLLPMVYHLLDAHHSLAHFPAHDRWAVKAMKQAAIQQRSTHAFLSLYRDLEEAGVRVLVFKGLVCRQLYGALELLRLSGDEDFFIEREDYPIARRILSRHGFSPILPHADQFDLAVTKEIGFRDPKTHTIVEVHFSFTGADSQRLACMQSFLAHAPQRAAEMDFHGRRIRTLCPSDHFLLLVFHACNHFHGYGIGLRHLMDLMLFYRRYQEQIHWDQVEQAVRAAHCEGFLGDLFRLGREVLGFQEAPVSPAPMSPALLRDLLNGGVFGFAGLGPEGLIYSSLLYAARALPPQTRQRPARIVCKALFPPASHFLSVCPAVQKHPLLLPLLWLRRWLRFLLRALTAALFHRRAFPGAVQNHLALLRGYHFI